MTNQEGLFELAANLRKVAAELENKAWDALTEIPDDIVMDFRWEARLGFSWDIIGYPESRRGCCFADNILSSAQRGNIPFSERLAAHLKKVGGEKLSACDRSLAWRNLTSEEFRDVLHKYPDLDITLGMVIKHLEAQIEAAEKVRPLLISLRVRQERWDAVEAVEYDSIVWDEVSGASNAPRVVRLDKKMVDFRTDGLGTLVRGDWIYVGKSRWGYDNGEQAETDALSLDRALATVRGDNCYRALYRYLGKRLAEFVQKAEGND